MNPFHIYPGIAQLVARVPWEHQAASSSLATRTYRPLQQIFKWIKELLFVNKTEWVQAPQIIKRSSF